MKAKLISILRRGIDFASILVHPLAKLWGKNKVRILCYHRVCELPKTEDCMLEVNVPPTAFAQQMELLSQNGFSVITLEQFIEFKDKNKKPPPRTVIITFDDGYRDNYLNAFPVLERYNFKGTFFIVTDYIDSERIFPWLKIGEESMAHAAENREVWLPLRKEEILEMSAHGACFGSHAKSHCSLKGVEESKAVEELAGSKECLERLLGKPANCFSYPYGERNGQVKRWVQRAGYRAAVAGAGSNTLESDFLELRRMPVFSQDSLAKFARKVEGAYDWWIEYLLPAIRFVRKVVSRG